MEDAFLSFDVPQETWDRGNKLDDATSDDDRNDDNDDEREEELRKGPEPEKWNTTFLHDYFT
ncbi:uncharacterized protein TrAtP1_012218 [Trichoderma atroviride]|uniref:uncharacterized protein n=1 Tax=Hypocrea atroviridis TaxID=63577 RepID=UPI003323D50F|nr:hypothetical protein TrAtP1_012218 [Trichoderma atroviride]